MRLAWRTSQGSSDYGGITCCVKRIDTALTIERCSFRYPSNLTRCILLSDIFKAFLSILRAIPVPMVPDNLWRGSMGEATSDESPRRLGSDSLTTLRPASQSQCSVSQWHHVEVLLSHLVLIRPNTEIHELASLQDAIAEVFSSCHHWFILLLSKVPATFIRIKIAVFLLFFSDLNLQY